MVQKTLRHPCFYYTVIMGGEGAMHHMRITLKTNRDLIGKRINFFKRKRSFGSLREKYVKANEELVDGPTPTKEELKRIRERLVSEEKERVNDCLGIVI